MALNLIFLGPPGAGKGTLAVRAKELINAPHISTGNIFREAIAAKTDLGLKVKAIIDSGGLVDDETTIALIKERLAQKDASNGYILDGFPRTTAQAEALSGFSSVTKAINFDATDDVVLKRLGGRRVCRKCGFNWHKTFNPPKNENICDKCGGDIYTRDDDKAEAVQKRLAVYREQTAPLIDWYKKAGLLCEINANSGVEETLIAFKNIFNL
ncbi:MAG: adenylate kinase [Spirochaetaceae bacterium]|jgi:adenylate kinase|nr:adenylate kinase [Spirochaetaceae bacterium]